MQPSFLVTLLSGRLTFSYLWTLYLIFKNVYGKILLIIVVWLAAFLIILVLLFLLLFNHRQDYLGEANNLSMWKCYRWGALHAPTCCGISGLLAMLQENEFSDTHMGGWRIVHQRRKKFRCVFRELGLKPWPRVSAPHLHSPCSFRLA